MARYPPISGLWFSESASDTAVEWKQMTVSGSGPAGRYFHGSDIDQSQARLVVVGGKLSGGTADSTAWTVEFDSIGVNSDYHGAKWRQLTDSNLGGGRANHTFLYPREAITFPRYPEIFNPATGSWTSQTGSLLHQDWYPPTFVSPNGNLFDACPIDYYTWAVSPSGGSWSKLPASFEDDQCGSAVMYRPGKIMRGGGEDHANNQAGDGDIQVIDLNDGSPAWADSDPMLLRTNHNFVLLPTGNVMVLGGTQIGRNNSNPVRRPQMWRPDTSSGGITGLWITGDTDADTLAKDPAVRGYHSTAILLPDGRILSAGGNAHADQTYATLYSPPYLFKSNGLRATRPNVTGAMTNVSWAAQDDDTTFFVFVSDTTHIQKVSMIRAPATTHAFDQSQRYVPVTFRKRAGRLELEAPADSMTAPPGYYQLFVSGSVDGKDVPSLARWVHIGRDVTPGSTLDFQIDWVATTSLGAYWTANADDNAEAASGRSTQNDFRYKLSTISTETDWGLSTAMTEPSPLDPGTSQDATFSGFSPCSTYYFAARSRDDVGNLSPIPSEVSATMLGVHCNNLVARVGGELAALRGRRVAATADGGESAEVASALIVETHRAGNGGWRVVVRQADDASTITGLTSDRDVEIQDAAGAGWSTSRSFNPSTEESEIGLCRVRDGGRTVLKNFYLSGIPASFRTSDGIYEIPVEERLQSIPALADGDSLVLEFDPVESDDEAGQWYLMAARVGGELLTASGPRPETERQDVPRVFALRQNQPNPFASNTRISFDLPVRIAAQIEIFDLQGRRVRTVASGERAAGRHMVDWDRRDDDGNVVRPGVYLYSIKAGSFREKKTMVLLK